MLGDTDKVGSEMQWQQKFNMVKCQKVSDRSDSACVSLAWPVTVLQDISMANCGCCLVIKFVIWLNLVYVRRNSSIF